MLLVLSMLVIMFAGCTGNNGGKNAALALVSEGVSEYVIVRGENASPFRGDSFHRASELSKTDFWCRAPDMSEEEYWGRPIYADVPDFTRLPRDWNWAVQ